MNGVQAPVVCLVHELGDRRVWWRLIEALPSWIRTLVVEQPPTDRLAPDALAEHIGTAARAVLPEAGADLVVASDRAAGAGSGLVADQRAAHALLVNPDAQALVDHPDYRLPEPTAQVAGFLLAMAPYQEQLREHGTLPEEGVEAMVNHFLGGCEVLEEQDRRLLHDIATAWFVRAMPFDLSDPHGAASSREHDWFACLSAAPERFTVYSGELSGLGAALRTVLSRNVPGAHVVSASTRTAFPWLEEPEALAGLITDHMDPRFREEPPV
ncbi:MULTISPECIES: hypothetical protein [Nocardiopsis]|uniref:Alpha/beta hydrolase n=1 Tax=Nocardiopsis sinuspersici TaxID=501010 RepID=A0A1V3BYY9_9ACTN|nr:MULTISPECIES: hypothetical protein [Nocardiopsis]NYH54845.1 hypothetical protein [Nocardiopsis sinuspersici]OOC53592.1 hypothetical protein NOSIN_07050 [Nocardiopsis sinuspersici]